MAEPARIAAGVVIVGLALAGGGAWWALPRRTAPAPSASAPPEVRAQDVRTPTTAARPASAGPDPAPGSIEARIADIEAALRDEQASEAAEAVRISGEVTALREQIAALEAQAEARRAGALARIDQRAERTGERCDPAEPDSRACRHLAALAEKQEAVASEIKELVTAIAALRQQEQALLAERTKHLAQADAAAARMREDPELQALYRQLGAGG
ncbi:MAG: hypothetical protein ABIO70_05830 [Pseudomonadota bacterium]